MALTKITSDVIETGAITSDKLASGAVSASSLSSITTDNVSEGSTNTYFTNARARGSVSVTGGGLSYDSGTGVIQIGSIPNASLTNSSLTVNSNSVSLGGSVTLDTDDIGEGSTNLYFTNARAQGAISGGTGVTVSSGTISIGQDVATSSTPTFGNITTTGYIAGPATFTIDPAAVGDNTGTVVIAGNLQVDGTTTTINSTTMEVDDLNITLASGAANAAAANGAGITVDGASATITYDGTNDEWDFNKSINLNGDITLTEGDKIKTSESSGGSHLLLRSDNLGVTSNSMSLVGLNDILIGAKSNNSGTGNIYFGVGAENKASGSGWTDTLTILESGNVGIGTNNPQFDLDVTGLIRATSDVYLQGDVYVDSKIRHNGDVDNYITFSAADTQGFITGNSTRLQITNSLVRFNQENNNQDFSVYSANSDNMLYVDASADGVGIGTDSPNSPLEIVKNITFTNSDTFPQLLIKTTATTTGNQLGLGVDETDNVAFIEAIDRGNNVIPLVLQRNAGRVGIGVDNPGTILQIGDGTTSEYITIDKSTTGESGILFKNAGNNKGKILLDSSESLQFYVNNTTNAITILESGNVGIGATSPQVKFHIDESSGGNLMLTRTYASTTGDLGTLRWGNTNWDSNLAEIIGVQDGANDSARLEFKTQPTGAGTTTRMSILSGGNVGIGSHTPTQSKLVVDGTISIPRSEGFQYLENISGSFRAGIFSTSTNATGVGFNSLRFFVNADNTDPAMVIGGSTNNKRVGIGTTNPVRPLHIHTTSNSQMQFTDDTSGSTASDGLRVGWNGTVGQVYLFENADLRFATNNDEKMRIQNGGNVGIGTDNPQYKFDVYGTSDVTMRIHRPSSGLAATDTCGIGFSQRGDTATSSSDTRAGIFSTYNGDLFLAVESGGNLNSNPMDHSALFIEGSDGSVGIGTTSPSQFLDVRGHTQIGDGGGAVLLNFNATGNAQLKFGNNEWLRHSSSGTTAIGNIGAANFQGDEAVLELYNDTGSHDPQLYMRDVSAQTATGRQFSVMEGAIYLNGTGDQIKIPYTTQGGSWRKHLIIFDFVGVMYNNSSNGYIGGGKIAMSTLSTSHGASTLYQNYGLVTSVTHNPSTGQVFINLSSSIPTGLSNGNGIFMSYKILTESPDGDFIDINSTILV